MSVPVRAALYRELFQFFSSSPDGAGPFAASARDLPRPLSRGVVHFYSLLKHATLNHLTADVADLVADALSQWFDELWHNLSAAMPREPALHAPGIAPSAETATTRADVRRVLAQAKRRFPRAATYWRHMQTRLTHADDAATVYAVRWEIDRHTADLRTQEWRSTMERAVRLAVTPMADHLNETLPTLADADRACRRILGRPGNWRIFEDTWRDVRWTAMEKTAHRLHADAPMQRVADVVTRGVVPEEPHLVWTRVPVPFTQEERYDAGLGDVDGLTGISGVASALPNELALLATPETEDLFARKLAEEGVMALHSRRIATRTIHRTQMEWRQEPAPSTPGPVLMCIDTSGSMVGAPDEIARTLVLGMVRSAIPYRRETVIIAVRDRLRVVTVAAGATADRDEARKTTAVNAESPSRIDETTLIALERFLETPAAPGADVSPALDEALSHVDTDRQAVADLVIMSDMHTPRLAPSHVSTLLEMQRRGVLRVHAVTISDRPMQDPMNTFDYHWHYNTALVPATRRDGSEEMIGFRHDFRFP